MSRLMAHELVRGTDETPGSDNRLWSGLMTGAPGAEVGVLGVPFDGAVCYRRGATQAPAFDL